MGAAVRGLEPLTYPLGGDHSIRVELHGDGSTATFPTGLPPLEISPIRLAVNMGHQGSAPCASCVSSRRSPIELEARTPVTVFLTTAYDPDWEAASEWRSP